MTMANTLTKSATKKTAIPTKSARASTCTSQNTGQKSGHWTIITTSAGRRVLAPARSSGIDHERVQSAIAKIKAQS